MYSFRETRNTSFASLANYAGTTVKIGLKYVATPANIFKSPYVVLEVQHSLNNNNLKLCVKMYEKH